MHIHSQATTSCLRMAYWLGGCVIISAKKQLRIPVQTGRGTVRCFPMDKATPQGTPTLRIPENNEQILSLNHPTQVYCCWLHNYELQKEKKKRLEKARVAFLPLWIHAKMQDPPKYLHLSSTLPTWVCREARVASNHLQFPCTFLL